MRLALSELGDRALMWTGVQAEGGRRSASGDRGRGALRAPNVALTELGSCSSGGLLGVTNS